MHTNPNCLGKVELCKFNHVELSENELCCPHADFALHASMPQARKSPTMFIALAACVGHAISRDVLCRFSQYEDDFTSGGTVHERDLVLFTFLTVLSLFDQVCKIVKEHDHMSPMLIAVRPEVKASS